jgi:low affinity Fe/Cu permease
LVDSYLLPLRLGCDDAIVGIEHLTEEEIRDIRKRIEERSSSPNGGKPRPTD